MGAGAGGGFDKHVSRFGSTSAVESVPRVPDGDGGTPEGDVFAAGTATSTCRAYPSSLFGNLGFFFKQVKG